LSSFSRIFRSHQFCAFLLRIPAIPTIDEIGEEATQLHRQPASRISHVSVPKQSTAKMEEGEDRALPPTPQKGKFVPAHLQKRIAEFAACLDWLRRKVFSNQTFF
jgi:hypothetical protein